MTLRPFASFDVRGHPGPAYRVNDICAVPGCDTPSRHAHHLLARSALRGEPYEWLQLADGTVLGNRVGLCLNHHERVTGLIGGHAAQIQFDGGLFYWTAKEGDRWLSRGPLDPQPPGARDLPAAKPEPDRCPSCGHVKPRKAPAESTAPRPKTTWTLVVPADAEIGCEVLDQWSDDFASLLGFGDQTSRLRRYHSLCTVYAWTQQNRDSFLADLRAAADGLHPVEREETEEGVRGA